MNRCVHEVAQAGTDGRVSPDVVGLEVDDRADEVLAHDHRADLLPVGRVLSEQQADGLECQLDGGGRCWH